MLDFRFFQLVAMMLFAGSAWSQSCPLSLTITKVDGSKDCFSNLAIANRIDPDFKKPLVEIIKNARYYFVAVAKSANCKATSVDVMLLEPKPGMDEMSRNHVLQSCRQQGCDCELVVDSGKVLSRWVEIPTATVALAQESRHKDELPQTGRPKPPTPDSAAIDARKLRLDIDKERQQLEKDKRAFEQKKLDAINEHDHKLAKDQSEPPGRAKELDDRATQVKALIGLAVVFRQSYAFCVPLPGSKCQSLVYLFEVKGKVKKIDLNKRQGVQVQVSDVVLIGSENPVSADIAGQGQAAAIESFRRRMIGTTQAKTKQELGLIF